MHTGHHQGLSGLCCLQLRCDKDILPLPHHQLFHRRYFALRQCRRDRMRQCQEVSVKLTAMCLAQGDLSLACATLTHPVNSPTGMNPLNIAKMHGSIYSQYLVFARLYKP